MNTATEGVTALLARYNEALNASSTDAVMPLYAEDGVFMPPDSEVRCRFGGCQRSLRSPIFRLSFNLGS